MTRGRHSADPRRLLVAGSLAACGRRFESPATATCAPPTAAPPVRPRRAGPGLDEHRRDRLGVIWDTLPTGFPTPPGATPAEEASDGSRIERARSSRATGATGASATVAAVRHARSDRLHARLQATARGRLVRLDMTGPAGRLRGRDGRADRWRDHGDDMLRGRLPARLTGGARRHPSRCPRATQRSSRASMLASTGPNDPVRPSLGEARSCNQLIRGTSGRSCSSWAFSSSSSSSA